MKLITPFKWIATGIASCIFAASAFAITATFTTETTNYDAAGGTVTFSVQVTREGDTLSSLGFAIDQPTGWSNSFTDAEFRGPLDYPRHTPEQVPFQGETTPTLGYLYTGAIFNATETFGFTANLAYPAGLTGAQTFTARMIYTLEGGSGQVTETIGTITIEPAPTAPSFTTHPSSQTINEGASVTFTAAVTGNPTPTLEWKKDGVAISGETGTSLVINSVTPSSAGSYTVTATNSAGSVTSNAAVLTVSAAPAITAHPQSATVNEGANHTFSVTATGATPLTYQWKLNGSNISGATSATLQLQGVTPQMAGNYTVDVTNSVSTATSNVATLTVVEIPEITADPTGGTVTAGGSITLSATATGTTPLTYQWSRNGTAITGATSSSLVLDPVAIGDAGDYSVVVSNAAGSDTSATATVVVQYAPVISQQPANEVVGINGTATFSVAATAVPTVSGYQWFMVPTSGGSGTPLTGQTSATLTLSNVLTSANGTGYYVEVTNSIGTTTSTTANLTVTEGGVVSTDPESLTVLEGESATFSIQFAGNPTPTIQWFKDDVAINGATEASYTIEATSREDSGSYTAVVTNQHGSDTSAPAALDVQFAVELYEDLVDQTAVVGSTVILAPEGDANPPPTFQWYMIAPGETEAVLIEDATEGELVLENVQLSHSGTRFYLIADNGIGEPVQTSTVTLTVQLPPEITLQPVGATLDQGQSHTFTIEVTGDPTPTIQWRKDGVNISGATGTSYTLSNVTAASAGTYTAVVSNAQASVTSNGAIIAVNTPPVITTQPVGITKLVGSNHTLSVAAAGTGPLTYQWKKNGADISGATGTSLAFTSLRIEDAGDYTVTVTNRLGSVTSSTATLTVDRLLKAPTITTQPRDTSARAGSSVTFTVAAEGNPLPTFQWRKNGAAISGATSTSFTIASVAAADAGLYDVVVTNSQGSVSSNLAKLTVTTADQAPVITAQPRDKTLGVGTSATFTVSATGVPAPTYQWRRNGVDISGATSASYTIGSLTLNSAGAYSVVVTNSAGSVTSRNAQLTVLQHVYAGTYFGSFGEGRGSFAIVIKEDNTGTFAGFDEAAGLYVAGTVKVNADGSFTLTVTSETAASASSRTAGADQPGSISVIGSPSTGRAEITFSGTISTSGSVTGTVTGVPGLSMSAEKEVGINTETVAGVYTASSGGSDAVTVTIVSPSGKALVVTKTATGGDAGVGTVTQQGAVSVTTVKNKTVTATVSAATSTIEAAVTDTTTGETVEFTGGNDEVIATQRLVNISTRAFSGSGFETTVAGLVISGEDSKPVLIRAVGPGLSEWVSGTLAAPKLELLRGQEVIASNTGWSTADNVDEVMVAANLAGAFALDTANADSVLLETLPPGLYTARASGADGGSGVVLIEIYDLSTPAPGQKLFNISTRAAVGSGDKTTVAGFVVSGSVPKRVLLRGVGPGLLDFGIDSALSDAFITVLKGEEVIATNDDWGTNAAAVAEASAAAGAFELVEGSKDAAIVISLEPGVYTLQLTGVGGATGIGLIEVYEIP